MHEGEDWWKDQEEDEGQIINKPSNELDESENGCLMLLLKIILIGGLIGTIGYRFM